VPSSVLSVSTMGRERCPIARFQQKLPFRLCDKSTDTRFQFFSRYAKSRSEKFRFTMKVLSIGEA
jgi:hypothetical protein